MLQMGLNKCSNAEYHKDNKFLSSSNYKTLLTEPEKFYKEKILGQVELKEEKNSFVEGSLTHSVILEPHLVNTEYVFYEGLRKAGADWEKFAASNKDRQIISKPQRIRVESFKQAYLKNPTAQKLFSGGEAEQTICVDLHSIPTKIRCDYINVEAGYIADLKTTSYAADVDTFRLTCSQFNYHLSAALYAAAASKFYGKEFSFYFVIISKKDLVCEVYKAGDIFMAKGLDDVATARRTYLKCIETGEWKLHDVKKTFSEEILEL